MSTPCSIRTTRRASRRTTSRRALDPSSSAGIGGLADDDLGSDALEGEQVGRRVEVERERAVGLDDPDIATASAIEMRRPAVAAKTELDRVWRRQEQRVRATTVTIGDEDGQRPLGI